MWNLEPCKSKKNQIHFLILKIHPEGTCWMLETFSFYFEDYFKDHREQEINL